MQCPISLGQVSAIGLYDENGSLSGLFSKNIWLVLGAGAVRNRTY